MIARQAIVNAQQVVGYELFNRSCSGAAHTAATDVILVFTALSHADTEELVGKKLIFVNCTHESLSGGHLELVDPGQGGAGDSAPGPRGRRRGRHAPAHPDRVARPLSPGLQPHGAAVGVRAPWLPLADYIKLDLSVLAPDQLAVLISYAGRHSKAELIAEKVETAQQYDMVSSARRAAVPGDERRYRRRSGRDQAAHAVPGQYH